MAKSGLEVQGLKAVVKSLESMGVEISDLKQAFGRIAARAAELAAGYAPVRSGRLRNSIKGSKQKNAARVRAGGARAPHAGAINYGWAKHNIEPQLFMQRADEAIRPDVVPMLEEEIGTLIRNNGLR